LLFLEVKGYALIPQQTAFLLFLEAYIVMQFTGRKEELAELGTIKKLKKASIVVVTGRRRIGKSTLIKHFASEFKYFYEFQGLPPREASSNSVQLDNFANQMAQQFGGSKALLTNWTQAFDQLTKEISQKKALIFLDELSWMGKHDPDFAGRLKIAWDTKLSRMPGVILVLCSSVSAWIEQNILKKTDFVGRVSLTLRLKELPLKEALNFWGADSKRISFKERMDFICVTGGVPKYLEEFDVTQSCQANIKRLCFTKGGYLYEDFEKIFSDIFYRLSDSYKTLLRTIVNQHLTPIELTKKLNKTPGGDISTALNDLALSGFISRDYIYKPGGLTGKLSKLRISDNYLRFYLKYIEPNKDRIEKGLYKFTRLDALVAWESIKSLQFENLVNNRIPEFIRLLNLADETIISAGPCFQTNTSKTKACQIDLLIECKSNNFYICEIKYKKRIGVEVIEEVKNKLKLLKLPKYSSRRAVLICCGEVDEAVRNEDFFDTILNLERLDDSI
jgi:uncharacterized protein